MKQTIHYTFRDTMLGLICMAATANGVCFVAFGEDRPSILSDFKKEFPEAALEPSDAAHRPELNSWMAALARHLDSNAELPDLPLDIRGSDFEKLVWRALQNIPDGQVLGYSQLAERVGRPSAVRAVASACGRNRIAILIPCHRVLRADGQLGGYRWGLSRKSALLEAEKPRVSGESLTERAS
jgi:AraC family transcriptional regulator of adaptative response/methylated-DNA-[protein]-cysteine methyltransferase